MIPKLKIEKNKHASGYKVKGKHFGVTQMPKGRALSVVKSLNKDMKKMGKKATS